MRTTKEILEELGSRCYPKLNRIQFAKNPDGSKNYILGKKKSYEYLYDLLHYFFQKDKSLLVLFEEQLESQKKKLTTLPQSEYKQGLLDALEEIMQELQELKLLDRNDV